MEEKKLYRERSFEVRLYLTRHFAEAVRNGEDDPAMKPLQDVLDRHNAKLMGELEKIRDFLQKMQEVKNWEERFPSEKARKFLFNLESFALRAVLDEKRREYLSREFYISMNGRKMFRSPEVEALIQDLEGLKESGILGTGPRIKRGQEPGVRKVYFPVPHPGTGR